MAKHLPGPSGGALYNPPLLYDRCQITRDVRFQFTMALYIFFSIIFGHFRSSIVKCYNEMAFSLYHLTMQGVTENGYSLIAQEWHLAPGPKFYNSWGAPKGTQY